jgi:hypothetical protein
MQRFSAGVGFCCLYFPLLLIIKEKGKKSTKFDFQTSGSTVAADDGNCCLLLT